jgi:hypothetical protein
MNTGVQPVAAKSCRVAARAPFGLSWVARVRRARLALVGRSVPIPNEAVSDLIGRLRAVLAVCLT